jgi:hypothetical protein
MIAIRRYRASDLAAQTVMLNGQDFRNYRMEKRL